jgi:hypothetical protein
LFVPNHRFWSTENANDQSLNTPAFFMPGSRNRPYLNDIQPADNCFEQIKLGSDPLDIFG